MLLSERSPEPSRHNRTTALPVGGLATVAIRSEARPDPEKGGRAFAMRPEPGLRKIAFRLSDEQPADPLYLFGCALLWRKAANTSAGWELIRCLRSPGQTARIAAALLAQGADIRRLTRAPARAIDTPGKLFRHGEPRTQSSAMRGLR